MYREADGPDDMRRAVREQIRAGADFIKIMTTGARSNEMEDPDPLQATEVAADPPDSGLRVTRARSGQRRRRVDRADRCGADGNKRRCVSTGSCASPVSPTVISGSGLARFLRRPPLCLRYEDAHQLDP